MESLKTFDEKLNLVSLEKDEHIRKFPDFYNENNEILNEYLGNLITTLNNLIKDYNEKIKYLENNLIKKSHLESLKSQIETEISETYIDKYNALLNQVELNNELEIKNN